MHLAYLDDSGSDSTNNVVVFGGVIIPGDLFGHVEAHVNLAVENLIPEDRLVSFEEFKAVDLFRGQESFKDIDEPKRFRALDLLLNLLDIHDLPYIYSAVDKSALAKSPLGSADPLDVAFRLCLLGIEAWASARNHDSTLGVIRVSFEDMCLAILDETDKAKKEMLRRSFLLLRSRRRTSTLAQHRLWHIHDAMYFGDSRDSVGIQLADICSYFMLRRLVGHNDDRFFQMLAKHALCAKPEPEWSTHQRLLKCHEAGSY